MLRPASCPPLRGSSLLPLFALSLAFVGSFGASEAARSVVSYDDTAPLATLPVVRWSVRLPGTVPDVATPTEPGAPVVKGDRIFVGYSGANALLVLSRADGRLLERIELRAPVASAAVVHESWLLVADSAGYTSHWSRGAKGWSRDWEHYSGAPILSTPLVDEASGSVFVTNVDELVFALDLATGTLKWRYEHRLDAARSAAMELFGAPAPTRANGLIYAGFSDGFLSAIDESTGSETWTASVGEGAYPDLIAPAIPLAEGTVLVSGYSKPLQRYDPALRTATWRVDAGSAAAPRLVGETVYHPGSDGKLRKLDARTGNLLWTWDSGSTGPLQSPEVTELGVLAASTDSTVFLIDAETGLERWRLDPGIRLTGFGAAPARAGNEIFALSNGGVLYALRGREQATPPASAPWTRLP
jgi:outer membrane protein assembly factor BamB